MGEINISRDEKEAIAAINTIELGKLVELAIQNEQVHELNHLSLFRCGPYILRQFSRFEQALARHRLSKSVKKRAETREYLNRAGHDLVFAVDAMKRRVETEQAEGELFQVDDSILPPHQFSRKLSVSVSYRWRRTTEEEWNWGSINFTHDHNPLPDHTMPSPKRKPSAAKREQDLQNSLFQTWEHLTRGALYSVRDYFREGGDGANIPASFQVTVDSYSRELNNFSTQFWRA